MLGKYYLCAIYGGYESSELLADNIEVYASSEADAKEKAKNLYLSELAEQLTASIVK